MPKTHVVLSIEQNGTVPNADYSGKRFMPESASQVALLPDAVSSRSRHSPTYHTTLSQSGRLESQLGSPSLEVKQPSCIAAV
jgi:hypothetical protein